jgi:hypothetical protein
VSVLVPVVAFWEPVSNALRVSRRRSHHNRVARKAISEFSRLVRNSRTLLTKAGVQIPFGVSSTVHFSPTRRPQDLHHLLRSASEFHTIVNAYDDTTLRPIFSDLRAEERQLVILACGSKVEAFRQRYMTLRNDYERFVRVLTGELRTLPSPQLYGGFPRADPLSG